MPPRSQVVGTRQKATSEVKDCLITEVNKFDVGTEATAFVFTATLLEGQSEVQHPTLCTTAQLVPPQLVPYPPIWFLYTSAMMRDLTVDSQRNLQIIQIKCSSTTTHV